MPGAGREGKRDVKREVVSSPSTLGLPWDNACSRGTASRPAWPKAKLHLGAAAVCQRAPPAHALSHRLVQTVTVLCNPPGVPFVPQPLKRRRELLRVLERNVARRNRRSCLAAALALSPRLSRRQAHVLLRRRSIAAMLPHKLEGIIEVPASGAGIPQRSACQPNVEVVVEVFRRTRSRTPISSERREQRAASKESSERKEQRAERGSERKACGAQGARSRACGQSRVGAQLRGYSGQGESRERV